MTTLIEIKNEGSKMINNSIAKDKIFNNKHNVEDTINNKNNNGKK